MATASGRSELARYQTKTDAAYEQVRSMILSGTLQAGRSINQEELAAAIGMSTTPVREALRRLAADGLVEIAAHRDARVAPLDLSEAVHIFEARAPLDMLALRLAAERHDQGDARGIREAAKGLAPARAGTAGKTLRRNRAFHRALYTASHNPVLIAVLDRLWDQSDRYRALGQQSFIDSGHDHDAHVGDHAELMRLVLERDGDAAAALMRDHDSSSLRTLIESGIGRLTREGDPT